MDLAKVLVICLYDLVDALDLGFIVVAIEREAVVDLAFSHETRYRTKTKAWEVFELVILLEDGSYFKDTLQVLVLVIL